MRLVCISDTHCKEAQVKLPYGDVLLVAGDFTSRGRDWEIAQFRRWLDGAAKDFRKIFICAGNHDLMFEDNPQAARALLRLDERIQYFENSGIEYDGVKFWFSPNTPLFGRWAFMGPPNEMEEKFAMIPDDTDVLVTHGPLEGVLDQTINYSHAGSHELRERIIDLCEKRLKLHVFGHIHEAYGVKVMKSTAPGPSPYETIVRDTTFANVSVCDVHYRPVSAPFVFDV